jgi:hypothetical protein
VCDDDRPRQLRSTRAAGRGAGPAIVVVTLLVAAAAAAEGAAPVPPGPAAARVQRGVGLGLFATDPRWDYALLLDEIAALGATHVQLSVVWTQRNLGSARVHRAPGTSPDDQTVLRTIEQARARGLEVTLFPIVRLEERGPKEWRGRIEPRAGVDAWFSSYRDFLLTMARLAARGGATRLSVGSELLSLERHEAHWRRLIDEVRGAFPGQLLYSANWDHFGAVPFWDALDEVGVTAYFELARGDDTPPDAALDRAWEAPRASLAALRAHTRKPLVITEVGYPSLRGAARAPWDETRTAALDHDAQARLLAAFCRALSGKNVVDGFYVWNWFGFGGMDDGSYTPREKPAARALARCLAMSW